MNSSISRCTLKNMFRPLQNKKPDELVITGLMGVGVILALIQFLYNRSLWLDEAMLALNIIHKSHVELLYPLEYQQSAPLLFLQVVKIFHDVSPYNDFGLRLFPLICFLLSLFLFYRVLLLLLKNRIAVIFGLSLFVFNGTLLYYSNELKPYITDVFVAITLFYLTIKQYDRVKTQYIHLAVFGSLAILLSNIAPIILSATGTYLLLRIFRGETREFKLLLIVGVFWLAILLVYYKLFLFNHPSRDSQIATWATLGAFLPTDIFSHDFLISLKDKIVGLFVFTLSQHKTLILLLIGLVILGVTDLFKSRKAGLIIFVCLPFLVHLLLAFMMLYPFHGRLVVYLVPYVMIAATLGFQYVLQMFPGIIKSNMKHLVAILFPLLIVVFSLGSFPKQRQEIKQTLQYLQENVKEGQNLIVYPLANAAFKYYIQTGLFSTDPFADIISLSWQDSNVEHCLEIVDDHEGEYWILFGYLLIDEDLEVVENLSGKGIIPLKSFRTKGSSAYLFDL